MSLARHIGLENISHKRLELLFVLISVVGSAVILSAFYLIDINALLDNEFLTVQQKVMGIGIFVTIAHVMLTYLGKIIFEKMQRAKSLLNQKNEELEKIDRAKTEFISMVTHELKTPLVPIISYTKMLLYEKFGELNDVQKEKLKMVVTGTNSLQILIQDILDLHKADLGKLKLDVQKVNVQEIIQEAIATTLPLANRRGIIIENMVLESCNLLVDRQRMVQVITNLIKNAIDFVPAEQGVIKIQHQLHDKEIILSVTDNGCGIPKEKLGGLFKKFYQIDTSTTNGRESNGLGLAICKIIVEQHNGKIWAESEVGIGTSMKLSVPIDKVKTGQIVSVTKDDNEQVLPLQIKNCDI